jgi:hypothetical protein
MAAALISGAAALIRSHLPLASPDLVESLLTTVGSVNIDAVNPQYCDQLGTGRLDIGSALTPAVNQPGLRQSLMQTLDAAVTNEVSEALSLIGL